MRKILFVLFFSISVCAEGQVTFQKSYGSANDEMAWGLTVFNDQSIFVTGSSPSGILLLKIDDSGNLIWSRQITTSFTIYGPKITRSPDQKLLISGADAPSGNIILMKIDTSGTLIWSNIYSVPAGTGYPNVSVTNDHGYILFFSEIVLNQLANVILKIDSLGGYQWCRSYGIDTSFVMPETIIQTDDGGYLFCGTYDTPGNHYLFFTMKINSGGHLVHAYTTEKGHLDMNPEFFRLSDNSFLLPGNAYYMCFDSLGYLKWKKYICFTPGHVVMKNNGHLFATGFISDINTQFISYGAMEIDSSANIINSVAYNNTDLRALYLLATNVDGTTICGGYATPNDSANIFLMKSDGAGYSGCNEVPTTIFDTSFTDSTSPLTIRELNDTCIITAYLLTISQITLIDSTYCYNFNSVFNDHSNHRIEISISPNPFHSSTTITTNTLPIAIGIKIYNTMGSLVRTEPVSNITSYILQRNGLTNGLYFYELRNNDSQLIGNGKFVIE